MSPEPLFRRTMTRRSMIGLTGGLLAAAAAGCAGPPGPTGAAMTAPREAQESAPALRQWYHPYGEDGTQSAVERYAASFPGAPVAVGWKTGDYEAVVTEALSGDLAPDVFEYSNGPSIDMLRQGQVADLTDLVGDTLADFHPALVKRLTYRDRLWAVPQVMDMQLLVYRPSMFDAAGVAPPTSIAELQDAAGRLTRGKVKGLFLGNDAGARLMGPQMLRSAGLDLLTPDGQIGFDDPAAATALGTLHTLARSGHLLTDAPADWYSAVAFVRGLTAMQFTGLWNLPAIERNLGSDFGVLPWPAMDGGVPNVPIGCYGACVSAKSRQLDTAKELVRWLWVDGTDKQVDFATRYGLHIPTRNSVAASAEPLQAGAAAEAVQLVHQHGFVQDHVLWSRRSQTAFGEAMTRIVAGGADPAKELAALTSTVAAELARLRS